MPTAGVYAIVNSSVAGIDSGCGTNLLAEVSFLSFKYSSPSLSLFFPFLTPWWRSRQLRVYVGSTLFNMLTFARTDGAVNFDVGLGLLPVGRVIYVAVGPGDDNYACDAFAWDFSIMQLPASSPTAMAMASSKYYARNFFGLQGTFAGFRRAFRSPSNLRDGWQYLYNLNGPIGNAAGYSVRLQNCSLPLTPHPQHHSSPQPLLWDGISQYSGSGVTTLPNANPASYLNFYTGGGGHTGPSNTTDVSRAGLYNRYAIAAYTVQYSGFFQISNSYLTRTGSCGVGVVLVVYVNNELRSGPTTVLGTSTVYFNMALGPLQTGDTVIEALLFCSLKRFMLGLAPPPPTAAIPSTSISSFAS